MAGRKTNPAEGPEAGPTFEEALERLETIVEQLESGELSLERRAEAADLDERAPENPPARSPRAAAKPSFDEGQLPF